MEKIPNKAFDTEYSTSWRREMNYLAYKGIKPCFTKETEDYHITVYKYKKTPELFKCLVDFYTEVQKDRLTSAAEEITSPEEIQKALEELGFKMFVQNGETRLVKCR